MPTIHEAADALVLYHTDAAGGANQAPLTSLGGQASPTRAVLSVPRITGLIRGMTVDYVSPAAGTVAAGEEGSLRGLGGDRFAFAAPGETPGPAVTIYGQSAGVLDIPCVGGSFTIRLGLGQGARFRAGQSIQIGPEHRETTLAADQVAGENFVLLSYADLFHPGEILAVGAGHASEEAMQVSTMNGVAVLFTAALLNNHAAGQTIRYPRWPRETHTILSIAGDVITTNAALANTHAAGEPVLGDGETKQLVSGADAAAFAIASRTGLETGSGRMTVEARPPINNALGMLNLSNAQSAAGLDRATCLWMENESEGDLTDVRIWSPPLADFQQGPSPGLPPSGGATLQFADLTAWPRGARFFAVTDVVGAVREIVSGYTEAHSLIVLARAQLGTTAQTSNTTHRFWPISGLRFRVETPTGFPESVALQASITAVPGGAYNRNLFESTGLAVGTLAPGEARGLRLRLTAPAGLLCHALVPVTLAWAYTDGDGVRYTQQATAFHRASNDLSATRYRAYRSVGEDEPVDPTGSWVAASPTRPFSAPLVADAINNLEIYKVNDYGLQGLIGQGTIALAGAVEEDTPPSAPEDLVVQYDHNTGVIRIRATYYAIVDGDLAADRWKQLVNVGGESIIGIDEPATSGAEVDYLDVSLNVAGYAEIVNGSRVDVIVSVLRGLIESESVSRSIIVTFDPLAAPDEGRIFVGQVAQE